MFTATLNTNELVITKETEKAIAIKGWCNYEGSSKTWEIAIWVPRSILKDGVIPDWFYAKKSNEFRMEDKHIVLESR